MRDRINLSQGVLTFRIIANEANGFRILKAMTFALGCWIGLSTSFLAAQTGEVDERELRVIQSFAPPKNATRLSPDQRVWVDRKNRRVIVDGYIVLRKGQLEMFACPQGTKEHESVVAVLSSSQLVHAGLLAAGAIPGKPTSFEPYRPATGSTIQVTVLWRDDHGERKSAKAQSWIRHAGQEATMNYDWVFSGSGIYKDPDTGKETYLGDSGDLICVANFPSATMDIAVESDSSASGLVFSANTDAIPPADTPVRLVLQITDDSPSTVSPAPLPPKGPVRDLLQPD